MYTCFGTLHQNNGMEIKSMHYLELMIINLYYIYHTRHFSIYSEKYVLILSNIWKMLEIFPKPLFIHVSLERDYQELLLINIYFVITYLREGDEKTEQKKRTNHASSASALTMIWLPHCLRYLNF